MKVILKIAFFLLLLAALGGANSYFINGPLLQSNTEVSMQQFKGVPATAGDFKVGDYWISFSTVYIVEVVFLALVGAFLFIPHIYSLLFGTPGTPAQPGVFGKK